MSDQPPILRFDTFELDRSNRQLRQHGVPIELGSRYFDALVLLVTRGGELVTKDEFMGDVWHGVPVTDEALTQCIRTLRRALDDDAGNPRFIQTIPKHGYRFIANPGPRAGSATGAPISHVAGACTLAGLAAGALAGLFYGIVAGTGGGGQVLILAAMIGMLGLLAGAGLGAGMSAAIMLRGSADWWMVAGSALGGLCVGAIGNLLGREGVGLLSGLSISEVTGPLEGVALGVATGLAAAAAFAARARRSVFAIAILAGTAAGVLIHFAGGTLLAGSLQTLQQGLPGTQLNVDKIGVLIGESGLTKTALAVTAIVEAQVFTLFTAIGLLAVFDRHGSFARYH